jgi:hypothetical protein
LDICVLAVVLFMRCNKKEKLIVDVITLYKINKTLEFNDLQDIPLEQ